MGKYIQMFVGGGHEFLSILDNCLSNSFLCLFLSLNNNLVKAFSCFLKSVVFCFESQVICL